MTALYSVAAVVAVFGGVWLALRLLGDALAWWGEMTRREGDIDD
jgi:hypothetical protein